MVFSELLKSESNKKNEVISKVMSGFFDRRIEVQKQLDYFLYKSFKLGKDITFDELKSIIVGEGYKFPVVGGYGNIHSTRRKTPEKDTIIFDVEFSKGATLTRHKHSDSYEIITAQDSEDPHEYVFTIVTGIESEGTMKEYIIYSGESMIIPPNSTHQVSNASKKNAELTVKFQKKDID